MKGAPRVLLVEDEAFVRESVEAILAEEGYDVRAVGDVEAALEAFRREQIDVVLTDLRLPGRSGMDLVAEPELAASSAPILILTGHGTVDDAVAAMRAGAFDFLQKPVEPDQLALAIRRALQHGQLVGEVDRLRRAVRVGQPERALVGSSPAMVEVRRVIEQVAATDATVLVSGESGTGKELVSGELHRLSQRAEGPLVLVNCAAVPATLFESEFFGHRRGAFSGAHADRTGRFAEASGGTLVLDEVHTLPLEVQAKLLRVLETGEYQMVGESRTRVVDVRVVAVTNSDLKVLVDEGEFRSDLYFRLDVFPISMPPLREHPEDIPAIALDLLARIWARTGSGPMPDPMVDADGLRLLQGYPWPGNVRELRNVLERASILCLPDGSIDTGFLEKVLGPAGAPEAIPPTADAGADLKTRLESVERHFLLEALREADGSKKDAALKLGIDPKNLSYYLRKHGIADTP